MAEISSTGDQMLAVLETVARQGPVSAADVAQLCDINRTVAYRLLTTLSQRAYVRRTDTGYALGPAALNLSRSAESDLRTIAQPIMKRLAAETGETVVLHAIDKTEAVVVQQALGNKHLVRVEHTPGSRHPLHRGASGWSILAFQDPKTIARILKKIENAAAAAKRIEKTKADGFAVSHDELQMGVHGIAAPLLAQDSRCEASLAILVPTLRKDLLMSLRDSLLSAAALISKQMR